MQKLSCPSIGTLNNISNTIHVLKMLGIQICKRYLKQDSQLFRGNRNFFPFFFFFLEWRRSPPHYQSVQRGSADAGRAELVGINIFTYTYHKNFLVIEDLMKLYRGKRRLGRPSSQCLSSPFLQKVKTF